MAWRRAVEGPITRRYKVGASDAQQSRWRCGSSFLGCKDVEGYLRACGDIVYSRIERQQKRIEREEARREEQRRKVLQEEAGKLLANWPWPKREES